MTLDDIRKIDPTGMYNWIREFHKQAEEAVRIGTSTPLKLNVKGIKNIVLTGLGGSAIGGDLLRSFLADELPVPFLVNRYYTLPAFIDKNSLVIVSSYSGNTEETISAYKDAIKRKAKVLCITTGGEVERLATKYKHQVIKTPPGLQPRAALGYSFFPLLVVLSRLRLIQSKTKEIRETIQLLKKKAAVYGELGSETNEALQLAQHLKGTLPILYSASEHFDAINVRWRGQIAENAKKLSFGHVLPEMNHNELVGWKIGAEVMKKMHVVFLRDRGTHKRVAVRENLTKQIVAQYAASVTEVWSEGHSLLARMFSLLYLADWVTYYLAILNAEDPTPVRVIEYLKGELAKV